MEAVLATIEQSSTKQKVEFKDKLTDYQYKQYQESLLEIEDFHAHQRLLEMVLMNHNEFALMFEPALDKLIKKTTVVDTINNDANKIFLNANRILLNYLSSIRTFLDHSETTLNRKFGPKSNQLQEFKRILSFYYDNSFAYRFFYKLRNYSQHCGLPLQDLHFNVRTNKQDKSTEGQIKIIFNRDKLLKNYNGWGIIVEKELRTMPLEFEVPPFLMEMAYNISRIENRIELLHREKLIHAAKFIDLLTRHLRRDNVDVCIVTDIEDSEDGIVTNLSLIKIPLETVDLILSKL